MEQLLGSCWAVVRQSSGSRLAVVGQSLGICLEVIRCNTSVIGKYSGNGWVMVRQSSGRHQAVVKQFSKLGSLFPLKGFSVLF